MPSTIVNVCIDPRIHHDVVPFSFHMPRMGM